MNGPKQLGWFTLRVEGKDTRVLDIPNGIVNQQVRAAYETTVSDTLKRLFAEVHGGAQTLRACPSHPIQSGHYVVEMVPQSTDETIKAFMDRVIENCKK